MEKLHRISRGTNRVSFLHTKVHKPCTAQIHTGFSICNQTRCSELFNFASSVICIWNQSSRHKSQILYDIVEIALSKMQSAKATSSADELMWLNKRQWLVTFAVIGSIKDKHLEALKESERSPGIVQLRENQHSSNQVISKLSSKVATLVSV